MLKLKAVPARSSDSSTTRCCKSSHRTSNRCEAARRKLLWAVSGLTLAGFAPLTQADTTWSTTAGSQEWTNPTNWTNGVPLDTANNGAAIINTATGNTPVFTTGLQADWDIIIGKGTAGLLTQKAGTLATGSGNWLLIGVDSGGAGTFNLTGGTFSTGDVHMARSGGGTSVGGFGP